MNLSVHPSLGFKRALAETDPSIAFIVVVPMAQTRLPAFKALFTIVTVSDSILKFSESVLCFVKSSTSTCLNVPKPTCNVIGVNSIPLISSLLTIFFVKCKPAVGAATAPTCSAKIV